MNRLVTLEELSMQIYLKEGIQVNIFAKEKDVAHLVRPYNYPKIDDELEDEQIYDIISERIGECLAPFKYYINSKGELI